VYNRVLLGLFVGLGDTIPLHPVLRGALLGALVSLAMALMNMIDVGISDSAAFIGFGIVYGIIADVVATRFS